MKEERFISIVIPNHNGAGTIGQCLEAAFASDYGRFEVVVVDDCSEDESLEIIRRFPCRLVSLPRHEGVSKARNAGARASAGELLFFIDGDCLLGKGALSIANRAYGDRHDLVLGGTYTPTPHDGDFFSAFQSISIHYCETRKLEPDYVAGHAMVIHADLFRSSGGFLEDSFIGVAASVEDVEFCHRLRRAGCELAVNRELQVRHIFNFSLRKSLRNAARKAKYWTMYSLTNGDLLADSGAASRGLKINVASHTASLGLTMLGLLQGSPLPFVALAGLFVANLAVNRGLLGAWLRAKGFPFAVSAACYYTTLYAPAVALGALLGATEYLWRIKLRGEFPSRWAEPV